MKTIGCFHFEVLALVLSQLHCLHARNFPENVPALLKKIHHHGMFLNDLTKAFGKGKTSLSAESLRKLHTEAFADSISAVALVNCDQNFNYRSITGYCNNLLKPQLGSAYSTFLRLQENAYNDSINTPRILSVTGKSLPSPRLVSNKIHSINPRKVDNQRSDLYMLWGQYLDHDMISTALTQASPVMNSCNDCRDLQDPNSHCFPISIPDDDTVFPNGTCMAFGRSINGQARVGPREQLNVVTSFIDASTVYGSEVKQSRELREFEGGRLKTADDLLPPSTQGGCFSRHKHHCFAAGDARNTVIQPLASLHTMWVWEHNRIAGKLKEINPHWDDERLYLEARAIIGAIHQRITYSEYLPITLCETLMRKYGIHEEAEGDDFKYYNPNTNCDPTIFTEFATAAFRFGHSMINPSMMIDFGLKNTTHELKGNFLNPDTLYENPQRVKGILCGSTVKGSQLSDLFIHEIMRNNLFSNKLNRPGLDLAAINIQRGRDHGIPSYLSYRKRFGLSVPHSFGALEDEIGRETVKALRKTYEDIRDIDLFTGILAERRDGGVGSVVGPLGARMIAEQFKRLKHCDRFWYSNRKSREGFTKAQIKEIRKLKLSDIICEHLPPTMRLREKVLELAGETKPCTEFGHMDFSHWKEISHSQDSGSRSNYKLLLVSPPRLNPEGPKSIDFGVEFRT